MPPCTWIAVTTKQVMSSVSPSAPDVHAKTMSCVAGRPRAPNRFRVLTTIAVRRVRVLERGDLAGDERVDLGERIEKSIGASSRDALAGALAGGPRSARPTAEKVGSAASAIIWRPTASPSRRWPDGTSETVAPKGLRLAEEKRGRAVPR